MGFSIHQALFGYDGGHQLLAASSPLPTEVRHALAIATDLSGSAPPLGFDHSYTGGALPGTNFYSLFCTWLAPEMRRPGCVWSHVLLIDLADIAELRELGDLRALFRRPSVRPRLEDYSRLEDFVDNSWGPSRSSASYDPVLAGHILAALYAEPEQSVVVPASNTSAYEELIFSLWSQQWPRLRRNFRFSTGSFADRGRGGSAFDLQVTPESNLSAWHRDRLLVMAGGEAKRVRRLPDEDEWLRPALDDLSLPDSCGLRAFLRTYGADVRSPRGAFRPLARMQARFTAVGSEPWSLTLRAIARTFPSPDEAGTLKRASVSKTLSKSLSLPGEAIVDRLLTSIGFLCLEDTLGAFARVEFDFTAAIDELWPAQRDAIVAILALPPVTEACWIALAKAVSTRINPDELPWLWERHPGLLAPFVRLNSHLASAPSLWRLPDRSQWAVLEGLEASEPSRVLWREVTRAMLVGGSTVAAREVTQRAGPATLDGALDWLADTPSRTLLPQMWREVLRPLAAERLSERTLSPLEFAFCAMLAPPSVAAALPATRPELQVLASEPLDNLPVLLQVPTAFLLVTLGLQVTAEVGAPLLARGFFRVHEALEGAVEPPEAWRLLQPLLPMVWFWQEWDRCFRLRRGLENWIHKNPGALKVILTAARTRAEREWLKSLTDRA